MSSIVQDELSQLTNEQLRLRLLEYDMANVPITSTTREVLLKKLRSKINAQQSTNRRETIHVTKVEANEEKTDSKSKKAVNRRNTVNAIPTITNDVAPVPKSKNVRRSGRVTPSVNENGIDASIVLSPSENDIMEVDEEPVREVYIQPKRTSRSPSLGKSQTVVTSYKTEVAKPIPIVESNEEDNEIDDEYDDEDDVDVDVIPISQNRLYPSLGTDNGFKKNYASSSKDITSNLKRTTMHTTNYEPTSYKPTLHDKNYDESTSFKVPLSKRTMTTKYSSYGGNISGPSRRYTSSTYGSTHAAQNYEDSGTEQSDIETPYLSNFARRLTQLKAEPLNRKILQDVKQHHRHADDSLWHSFTMLVIAFGRKFGSTLLAFIVLMILVFVYVFFIMG